MVRRKKVFYVKCKIFGSGNEMVEKQIMPIENNGQKKPPKIKAAAEEILVPTKGIPTLPSKEERARHALTHIPPRDWCEFCIRG